MPRPNAKVKSVHFNITVEEDCKMLQHIGKRSFSKYVKELIQEDIKKKNEPKPIQRGGITYLPKDS
jgi:predicted CopG family antitoxin